MEQVSQQASASEPLVMLARTCGVSTDYYAHSGQRVQCSADAIRAALAAMGIDASTDEACRESLATLEDHLWLRVVPPVTVLREAQSREIPVHIPHGLDVAVRLIKEDGGQVELRQLDRLVSPRQVGNSLIGRATFLIPEDLPLGWHQLEAVAAGRRGRGFVVVTPERIEIPEDVVNQRPWGFMAQLYSVRSSRSWGMGDFGDLAELCGVAKVRAGADFVLINPVHATEPVPPISASPYFPSSRRYLSPLYIRVEDIPEVAYVPSQQRAVIEWEAERPRRANDTDELIDRDWLWRAKAKALEQVYAVPRSAGRDAQFEAYCLAEGRSLEDFATWSALAEAHKGLPWPEEFHNPASAAVSEWRDKNADRVLFYAWLQWIADEQAQAAQNAARRAGMTIGVIADLAVGVSPLGADSWSLNRVLAQGIGAGAPPDMYNQQGQSWNQPPWQPRALEAAAYVPFRDVVRSAVRNAGAVRIDHIMGLFRLWWVRDGAPATDGVYVQYDHDALTGILALEAHRAGAFVIGEDLGTVEPWVREYLSSRGILGTSVMWFEKDATGAVLPPEAYRQDVLATVTTHDLPPTAAYLEGEHVRLREELGLLVTEAEAEYASARAERDALVSFLDEQGWLVPDFTDEDVIHGAHRLVMRSGALLTGVALTDAVGDRRAQNMPGTFLEYPNWRVPLCDANGVPVLLDELFEHPRMRRLIAAIRSARD